MLTLLSIRNYAIVSSLDLELKNGMTVVSGETGAGKSIMLDALGLALGKRAESDAVRAGAKRAEISAVFDISKLAEAQQWLASNELEAEDENECLLRRTLTDDGRSRAYINGHPCPLARVRELGELLVDIHGQHEHQRLLKRDYHRQLLDAFAQSETLAAEVRTLYTTWQSKSQELLRLQSMSEEASAQLQLLSYQTDEINQLNPEEGELALLEQEQKELANAGAILQRGQLVSQLLGEGDNEDVSSLRNHALHLLGQMEGNSPAIRQTEEMLNSALIQVEEAQREIEHYLQNVELNPERLNEVEERLSALYDLARKHRIAPEQLPELMHNLNQQLARLSHVDEDLEHLDTEVERAREALLVSARKLSKAREASAVKLSTDVNRQLEMLGMGSARFKAQLSPIDAKHISAHGLEEVEFLISTNTGQGAKPLARVASGGELSRISLAIQVVTAQVTETPTLIFDEVDVGIGGGIAEVVGDLLRTLGERSQVLVVTHQPQVAAKGHQHLLVTKTGEDAVHSELTLLAGAARIEEVGRMLGGAKLTDSTLAHAREMLEGS